MPNEASNQTGVVPSAIDDSQATPQEEPVDIAAAFQLLREGNQKATQSSGQEEESNTGNEVGEGSGEQGVSGNQEDGVQVQPDVPVEPTVSGGTVDDGGSTTSEQTVDYSSYKEDLIKQIQQDAQRNVAKKFQDNKIRIMSVGDLYQRDEDGSVTFVNPDNPNRPFESRSQAQDWVNSMNQMIRDEYQKEVTMEMQELYKQAAPVVATMEFAPTYDAMDDVTKSVFDSMIEPYSVYNANKEVIGFNCNLNAMAQQAAKIVQQFAPQQQQPQQVQQQTNEPAMDLKGGASESPTNEEPTNIQEAWQMLNKSKKKG